MINMFAPELSSMTFSAYVLLVGFYTDEIQEKLKEIGTNDVSSQKRACEANVCFSPISHSSICRTKSTEGNAPTYKSVERLRLLYGKIDDMKEAIMNVYAVHVLMTITSIFIEMVFFVFVIITIFQYWNTLNEKGEIPWLKIQQVAVWTLSQLLKLLITVVICHSTTEKAKKTGVIVHRYFHKARDIATRNEVRRCDVLHLYC